MKPEELIFDPALVIRLKEAEKLQEKIVLVLYNKDNNEVTDVKTLKPPRHAAQVLKGCLPEGTTGELFDYEFDSLLDEDEVAAGKYFLAFRKTATPTQIGLFVDAVNGIRGDMRTLLARLPEGKKKAKSTGFSSVGSSAGGALLKHFGFEPANGHQLLPLETPPPGLEFPDFDYSQFPDENAGVDKASAHHCASLGRMGVKFGAGGFHMMDVHNKTDLMSLDTDAEDEEAARFRGTTDLLLVPNGTDTQTAPAKASLAVDHKQSFEDKVAYNRAHGKGVPAAPKKAEGQGTVIQLAICSYSKKPCDVVITNGHNCTLFRLRGKILYTYEHISMTQMYWSVGSWLAAHQEVLAKFSISDSDLNHLDSALLEPYRLMTGEAEDEPMAEQIEVVAHNLPEAAMPAAVASVALAYVPACEPMMPEAFHRFYKE